MTKGALYKHYKNKRDIFGSIVERIYLEFTLINENTGAAITALVLYAGSIDKLSVTAFGDNGR